MNAEGTEELCLTVLMIARIIKQQWQMNETRVWSIGRMILKGEFFCVLISCTLYNDITEFGNRY